MIYTVTFNPAIDYVVQADDFCPGGINRLNSEKIFFGGKGINVSAVLRELGISSKALGFIAGFTGDAIENGLREMGVETDFIHLKNGFSRINVKIKSDLETELNGGGPNISEESISEFFDKLRMLKNGDTLVLAGSIPKSVSPNIYEDIPRFIADKDIRMIVDAEKYLLLKTLKFKPFLIKPNIDELKKIFETTLRSDDEIVDCAVKLQEMGAKNVLVSMAEKGALLLDEGGTVRRCGAFQGIVRNSVGAGDAMVAGFIAGFDGGNYEYALKLGTACGGAAAFSYGLPKKEEILALLESDGFIIDQSVFT